jgi:hypothetical protein
MVLSLKETNLFVPDPTLLRKLTDRKYTSVRELPNYEDGWWIMRKDCDLTCAEYVFTKNVKFVLTGVIVYSSCYSEIPNDALCVSCSSTHRP